MSSLRDIAMPLNEWVKAAEFAHGPVHMATMLVDLQTANAQLSSETERLRAEVARQQDINKANGCPDCGVHHGCGEVVAERDRLRDAAFSSISTLRSLLNKNDAYLLPTALRPLSKVADMLENTVGELKPHERLRRQE
jgi:hypothetical protein